MEDVADRAGIGLTLILSAVAFKVHEVLLIAMPFPVEIFDASLLLVSMWLASPCPKSRI